jgi:hypothetical protein
MKLVFDFEVAQYHPTTGLILHPGEFDYPDEKAEQLIAAGLKPASAKRVVKKAEE